MPLIAAEGKMWIIERPRRRDQASDASINEKYARGEGRIVVEQNREKLPGFVEQLKKTDYMDLRPFYQRRSRWETERQSRLIESFIMNVPVPPIFLYEKSYNSYEVMDGQQRITAIRDFYENKFSLTGLQHWPELNGRFYHNLPSMVRAGIDRRSISSIVMLKESAPEDEEAMVLREIVFERLNTGGVELERQEIRNALYQGPLNDLLLELSHHAVIRAAWGLPEYHPDELVRGNKLLVDNPFFQKMEDAELVLRFFALRNVAHYRRGMQGFLDLYMMRSTKFNGNDIVELRGVFEGTIQLAMSIYEEKVFRPYDIARNDWAKSPQKAYYDAVMVGLSSFLPSASRLISMRRHIIDATRDMFLEHEEGTFTGRGNSKADIEGRIQYFEAMIKKI